MKRSIGYLMLCFLVLSACNRNKSASTQGRKAPSKAFQSRIIIQPLDKVDDAVITHIERQFKAIFGDAVRVTHAVALPNSCLNQSKTRYRADSILKFLLSRTKVHEYTLGITANDISTTKGNYADWGVMGLGYHPGQACVASLYRLKGANRKDKLFKVAIHELGHTLGLSHCPEATCIMRDAEGKDHLDEEKDFCETCKASLRKVGWALK